MILNFALGALENLQPKSGNSEQAQEDVGVLDGNVVVLRFYAVRLLESICASLLLIQNNYSAVKPVIKVLNNLRQYIVHKTHGQQFTELNSLIQQIVQSPALAILSTDFFNIANVKKVCKAFLQLPSIPSDTTVTTEMLRQLLTESISALKNKMEIVNKNAEKLLDLDRDELVIFLSNIGAVIEEAEKIRDSSVYSLEEQKNSREMLEDLYKTNSVFCKACRVIRNEAAHLSPCVDPFKSVDYHLIEDILDNIKHSSDQKIGELTPFIIGLIANPKITLDIVQKIEQVVLVKKTDTVWKIAAEEFVPCFTSSPSPVRDILPRPAASTQTVPGVGNRLGIFASAALFEFQSHAMGILQSIFSTSSPENILECVRQMPKEIKSIFLQNIAEVEGLYDFSSPEKVDAEVTNFLLKAMKNPIFVNQYGYEAIMQLSSWLVNSVNSSRKIC